MPLSTFDLSCLNKKREYGYSASALDLHFNHNFEWTFIFHSNFAGYSGGTQTSGPPQQPGPPQESPSVMQPSFDVQVRSISFKHFLSNSFWYQSVCGIILHPKAPGVKKVLLFPFRTGLLIRRQSKRFGIL